MATSNEPVSKEKFTKLVNDLRDNSDFFDPFYVGDPELYTPLTKEDEIATEDPRVWEVIDFLQTYSDVNLLDASETASTQAWHELITRWYTMYFNEAVNGSHYGQ